MSSKSEERSCATRDGLPDRDIGAVSFVHRDERDGEHTQLPGRPRALTDGSGKRPPIQSRTAREIDRRIATSDVSSETASV